MTNQASVKWRGPDVLKELQDVLSDALVEITMLGEQKAKEQLYPGHGYDTGALQRSLHSAGPDYNWRNDDVPRGPSTPERGGRRFTPKIDGAMMRGALGSGQKYAIWVHQGHHSWPGYHYIRKTVPTMRHAAPDIIGKHAKKRSAR